MSRSASRWGMQNWRVSTANPLSASLILGARTNQVLVPPQHLRMLRYQGEVFPSDINQSSLQRYLSRAVSLKWKLSSAKSYSISLMTWGLAILCLSNCLPFQKMSDKFNSSSCSSELSTEPPKRETRRWQISSDFPLALVDRLEPGKANVSMVLQLWFETKQWGHCCKLNESLLELEPTEQVNLMLFRGGHRDK